LVSAALLDHRLTRQVDAVLHQRFALPVTLSAGAD